MDIDDVTWDDLNEDEVALLIKAEDAQDSARWRIEEAKERVAEVEDDLDRANAALEAAEAAYEKARQRFIDLEAEVLRRVAERIGSDE